MPAPRTTRTPVRARPVLLALLLAAAGCRRGPAADVAPPAVEVTPPRVEQVAHGPVDLTLTLQPPQVDYARDTILTIEVSAPAGVEIALPALNDRAQGFILNGAFEDAPEQEDGRLRRRLHARLTPVPGREHRLAPIPVVVRDMRRDPPSDSWFHTPPLVLEDRPPFAGPAGGDVRVDLEPVWIYPPFRTVAGWVLLGAAALALLLVLARLLRRLQRHVQILRLSPRDRALRELALLLARDLVGGRRIKDFYVELTMIVRRYIERAHGIRAPEQTTEEFLAAVRADPRFAPAVLERLKAFLEAADLVKFAGRGPTAEEIRDATSTARLYIESDAGADAGERVP